MEGGDAPGLAVSRHHLRPVDPSLERQTIPHLARCDSEDAFGRRCTPVGLGYGDGSLAIAPSKGGEHALDVCQEQKAISGILDQPDVQ
jgi:hypothetical protein